MKEITHDLNHDLTFYCTHNQLCVPQYIRSLFRVLGIYNFAYCLIFILFFCKNRTKKTNNFMTLYILQSTQCQQCCCIWPFHYLSFTLLPFFFAKISKIEQQFHDTLYFCKVLNAISEVEFLLLHIVGMQKSKYTTGYLTIQDNNQKCRSKRILRSNFPYLMHFRKGEKAAVVQPKVIMNTKGQLISKGHFGFFNSSKNWTKHFCSSRLGQKFEFSSSFFGRIEGTQKDIFKINWPLVTLQS